MMSNLLRADFSRLIKSKIFWLAAAAILIISTANCLDMGRRALANVNPDPPLEYVCFKIGPFLPIFIAAFISIFLGTEYSDGTIRNKVVIGQKRSAIYLANSIVCGFASMVMCVMWHIGSLAGLPLLGVWQSGVAGWLIYVLISMLFTLAISAIFCLISHLWTSKAASAVFSIILALVLIIAGSYLYNNLLEPEETRDFVTAFNAETGEIEIIAGEARPNPEYIAEPMRTVCMIALNSLPTGQAILLANITDSSEEMVSMPLLQPIPSIVIVMLFTAVGCAAFKRKDLK